MADNLVDLVSNYFDPNVTTKLASSLGVSLDQVQAVIDNAIPATLAGVAGVASTSAGAQKIADAIGNADQDMLGNLQNLVTSKELSTGGLTMLNNLVGADKVSAITSAVSAATGAPAAAAQSILGVLGPATFGALGQLDPSAWSSGDAIAKTFAEQKDSIMSQLPAGLGPLLSGAGGLAGAAGALKGMAGAAASAATGAAANAASSASSAAQSAASNATQAASSAAANLSRSAGNAMSGGSSPDRESAGVPSWVWIVLAIIVIAGVAWWYFKMRGA